MTVEEFFSGFAASEKIFKILCRSIDELGEAEVKVTKSQIAFRRKRTFAIVWVPDRYLSGGHAPLVLTLSLHRRDSSPRWKEVVEPYPGRFTHHLELYSGSAIDRDVHDWLKEAWDAAGL